MHIDNLSTQMLVHQKNSNLPWKFSNSEVIELEKCKSRWNSNEVKLLLVCALTIEVNPIILDCFQWYLLTGEAYRSLSWCVAESG